MSQSIEFVLSLGGEINENTDDLATVYVTADEKNEIVSTLSVTESNPYPCEWHFDDGSIIVAWYAGIYSKLPYYFMAYSIKESNAIRYRRENPTPDTSHE